MEGGATWDSGSTTCAGGNATAMVLDGVDAKTFQARQGHSDACLTLAVYAQVTTEGDRTTADRLGGRFLRSGQQREGQSGAG